MAISKSSEFNDRQIRLAQLCKALGHPARIAIMEVLANTDHCMCGNIASELPLAQSTISQHLKILKEAGLITGKIDGISICYDINPDVLEELKENFGGLITNLSQKEVDLQDLQ